MFNSEAYKLFKYMVYKNWNVASNGTETLNANAPQALVHKLVHK